MPDVICLGEALIDFIALESGVSLMEVSGFKKAPGGAPANVAAGLAKLGNPSAFVGKVGDDAFGRFLAKTFADAGVDVSRMLYDTSARTGLAFVSLTAEGVPEFMFYRNPSADMLLTAEELDGEFIRSARAFHYGSITLISEPSKSATEAAIEHASKGGLLISYDPNLRRPLWPSESHAKREMLAAMVHPHVVKLSEEELAFLSDTSDGADLSDLSERLLDAYPNIKLLAVTRGAEGCYFRTAKAEGAVPSFKVEVVDTTGAGDGFVAVMLSCLLAVTSKPEEIGSLPQDDLARTFRFANAVAALTTTKRGAISALPTRSEVEAMLAG
ncbi:MAG: PfkB family carbohydrate kinase [Armatimonadetes bacterium]|nr:PfkB family carbohydrate kinase [Armatimonadota bacterium]